MRLRRIVFASTAAVIAGGTAAFFSVIPHAVDRHWNALGHRVPPFEDVVIPDVHRQAFVVDLHADSLLWDRDLLAWNTRGHVDLPRLQKGGVALQVFSIVTKAPRGLNIERNSDDSDNITILAMAQRWPVRTWNRLDGRVSYQIERLYEAERESRGQLRLIRSRSDLERLIRDRQSDPELVGAMLAIEGAHALEGDLSKLAAFADSGVRMVAPTHLFDSDLAGSQQGVGRGGLTELGRQWLAEMERLNLIVDLAHASERAIEEILAASTRPPVVSHTGIKRVCDNNRNLSDSLLRKIAAKGGLIGIGFWREATCGDDLPALVRALRAAVDVVGIEHVALGSDWDGFVATPVDAARLPLLTVEMAKAGFSEDDIRRLLGGNAIEFLRRSLP